jgi:hypothetical protein
MNMVKNTVVSKKVVEYDIVMELEVAEIINNAKLEK